MFRKKEMKGSDIIFWACLMIVFSQKDYLHGSVCVSRVIWAFRWTKPGGDTVPLYVLRYGMVDEEKSG